MAGNKNLNAAAQGKNDEFYTQYGDIQRELNCYYEYDENFLRGKTVLLPCDDPEFSNFTKFFAMNFGLYGLKKLISTSYAAQKKKFIYKPMRNLFDDNDLPQFDASKDFYHGRIYTLEADDFANVSHEYYALKNWRYLEGDGDFRSAEVKRLRDQADVIITNPPFSLFREFLKWILDAKKQFLIIGNLNNVTYKEIFPLVIKDKIWLGYTGGHLWFTVPSEYEEKATDFKIDEHGQKWRRMGNIGWFTNLDTAIRHEPLRLMTYADCEQFHPKVKDTGFQRYDNYDAIEVPYVDAIPRDYDGVMGVPLTFISKYCPEQFEILGLLADKRDKNPLFVKCTPTYLDEQHKNYVGAILKGKATYTRLLIRRRQQ